jgi:hypothetical protein
MGGGGVEFVFKVVVSYPGDLPRNLKLMGAICYQSITLRFLLPFVDMLLKFKPVHPNLCQCYGV